MSEGEKRVEYWPNGKRKKRVIYWPNGQKEREVNYNDDGIEDGLTTYWFENGQKWCGGN